jgi:hypothetical protein
MRSQATRPAGEQQRCAIAPGLAFRQTLQPCAEALVDDRHGDRRSTQGAVGQRADLEAREMVPDPGFEGCIAVHGPC